MADCKEELIEVGLRFNDAKFEFFGTQDVNEKIQAGMVVKSVDEGRAIMRKVDENDQDVSIKFIGFSVLVTLVERDGDIMRRSYRK